MTYYPPKPMRADVGSTLHRRFVVSKQWVAEPKRDGWRCIALGNGELWSRHGNRLERPALSDAVRALSLPEGAILDCELYQGKLYAFDMPSVIGTLQARYRALKELVSTSGLVRRVTRLRKATAYETALDRGLEGLVWKRTDSPYDWQRGPCNNTVPYWVKMKP